MRTVPESEAIERAALFDIHEAASAENVSSLRLGRRESGFRLASFAAGLPPSAIVINRCIGLGIDKPVTLSEIASIVEAYRDAGVTRYFIQRHPDAAPAEIAGWLARAGLEKARGWQKFQRDLSAPPVVETNLRVEQVGEEHGEAFANIVCDAFDLRDAAKPWIARLPGRPRWHVFMSFDGEESAGCGALFIDDGVAWSDFGATAPAFRRRGSQGAVLAKRIEFAAELGCTRIHTCTGEDVAGDPQHSFGNILKMGFEPTYVRQNYAPAAPAIGNPVSGGAG